MCLMYCKSPEAADPPSAAVCACLLLNDLDIGCRNLKTPHHRWCLSIQRVFSLDTHPRLKSCRWVSFCMRQLHCNLLLAAFIASAAVHNVIESVPRATYSTLPGGVACPGCHLMVTAVWRGSCNVMVA